MDLNTRVSAAGNIYIKITGGTADCYNFPHSDTVDPFAGQARRDSLPYLYSLLLANLASYASRWLSREMVTDYVSYR